MPRDPWDEEKARQEQEKWEEKYWSEIEDGICPPVPRTSLVHSKPGPLDPKWKKILNELDLFLEKLKKKKRMKI